MRKLNISPPRLVFMAGVALLCACHKSENEQIFDKLDRVIAKKHLYEERFVRHADSLRRELRAAGDDTLRWQTANRLFDSYITYNIDTAARYAGLMHNYADATGSREMKFLSTTCDVSVLIARNNIEEAYERILSLDTVGITRRMRASYYTQQMVVFGRLASGDGSEARRKAYADSLFRLRHTRIGFDGHSHVTRQRMYALELMDQKRYDEALEVLLPLYDPAKYNSRTLARIAYNIANACYLLDDVERHKYWLATAAICDLQTPVREYLSLYNLALLMFEQQDMERAARYIQCTMADMLACNYNTRIFHSSQAEMIINQAVVYSINSRSRILTVMINIFMGLFVIIVLLLIHTLRQHARQRRTNAQLSAVNAQLSERNEQFRQLNDCLRDANKIKDNYVFRYMLLATQYLGRVDEYRGELLKTAKSEGSEALMRKLRSPSTATTAISTGSSTRPSWASFPISSSRSMRCSRSRRGSPCGPTGRSLPSCVSWPSCASALPTAAASPVSSTALRRRSIPTAPSCAIRPSVRAAISRTGSGISASEGVGAEFPKGF